MCPEQSAGDDLDARSDRFSFGTVFHRMAAGRLPFQGKTAAVIFDAILKREPERVLDVSFGIGKSAISNLWRQPVKGAPPSRVTDFTWHGPPAKLFLPSLGLRGAKRFAVARPFAKGNAVLIQEQGKQGQYSGNPWYKSVGALLQAQLPVYNLSTR
jgi:hypothetical protein